MVSKPSILKMFANSPIRPLQKHMKKANECVQLLCPFMEAVLKQDWDDAQKQQKLISSAEHAADRIKIDLRLHLPKGLFLSIPRSDLLYLLTKQEDLADGAQDIAGLIFGRKMIFPEKMANRILDYIQCTAKASKQASQAISELDELFEFGFRGKVVEVISDMIQKLNTIEHDSDKIQVKLRRELYAMETKLPPVDVMFIYRVIDWIAALSDYAQKIGGGLQILLAR